MKFILFNLCDVKNNYIKKVYLNDTDYINEICISKSKLEKRLSNSKGFLSNTKNNFYDKALLKLVIKGLDKYDKKWYYILSKNFNNDHSKFITNKLQEILGYKFIPTNELDNNIFKYMEEHILKLKTKLHDSKALVIWTNIGNFNIQLIKKMILKLKNVNIYLNDKPSSYILKQIKQINNQEGTAIEIIKKEKKALQEYDFVYFADDYRHNYPRFRMNKDALVIDILVNDTDKYNSNIVYYTEYLKENFRQELENLEHRYNMLEFASVVKKSVN